MVAFFRPGLDDWTSRHKIATLDQKEAYFAGFLEAFEAEIRQAEQTHHTMVITSEHFHSRLRSIKDIERLGAFLKRNFDHISVVSYFREQSRMALSAYSTTLKAGGTATLDAYLERVTLENSYFNFMKIGRRWSSVFGKENCNFRIYDRALFVQGDLRRDFLTCLPRPPHPSALSFAQTYGNESLSDLQAALFRVVNAQVPWLNPVLGGVNPVNLQLKKAIINASALKLGRIDSARVAEIFDTFEASNRSFSEAFFDGKPLFQRPTPPQHDADMAGLDLKELSSDLGVLIGQVIEILKD